MTRTSTHPVASFSLEIPGDVDYIPPARKFVYETMLSYGFSTKFAYRSEVVIDEVCNNAVMYGCNHVEAVVYIHLSIFEDRIELEVRDSGGNIENKKRLRNSLDAKKTHPSHLDQAIDENTLGLEMVKLLASHMQVAVDDNNTTSIRVIRKREELE